MVWVDVDVDLADLDDEDIEAEYFRRKNIKRRWRCWSYEPPI